MKNSISVVIPTYNRSGLVKRAVESVLSAISLGDEVIVIDDGSTDDTTEVLRPYGDKIRYVRTENSGLNSARDLGVQLSRCPLVAFLDSDDEWLTDKLYIQRAVMGAFPDAVFCFSDLLSRHHDGKISHNVLAIWSSYPWVGYGDKKRNLNEILGPGTSFSSIAHTPEGQEDFSVHMGDIYPILMEVYYVWACTIIVRKAAAGASFRFARDQHQICEDWECFARLAKAGPAVYINCELAVQNVHTGPRLTDVEDIVQATERIKLLNRVWGADETFMRAHSLRFQSVLKAQHLRRAKYLIKEGRMREAREDLRIAGGPMLYRLLAGLPSSFVNEIFSMRRKLLNVMRNR